MNLQQQFQTGYLHHQAGRLAEAAKIYRQVLAKRPNHGEALHLLGLLSSQAGQLEVAADLLRRAVQAKPGSAEAYGSLGNIYKDLGRLDEAAESYRQAIRLKFDLAEAYSNLGNVLKSQGRLEEAISAHRQAIKLRPDLAAAHSNLIYDLHFHPDYNAGMLYEEHRRWNEQHAQKYAPLIKAPANDRNPDRPLRVGYVSPDFCEHPVGRFILPLLAAHDRNQYSVFCYSSVRRSDHLTASIQRHCSQWRDSTGLDDERLAEGIKEDRIDILVDLTMHMSRNRMQLFARKPAPIQVTYLAYCSTTGLDAIDYRLSDPHLDPLDLEDTYSEKTIRLPDTYWCYQVDENCPPVDPLPAYSASGPTFGCLNNFCKSSPGTFMAWIQVLSAVRNSRLVLHAREGSHRTAAHDLMRGHGVDPERLTFVGWLPYYEYLKLYQQIDIGLDPFPCNGGTTTCNALWMGVPVVTLAGQTAVGRGGVSVLRNIGLPDLIAQTPEQYVEIAIGLTKDLARLAKLRETMRERMLASPLMDAPRLAANVEAAYRQMWRDWCNRPST